MTYAGEAQDLPGMVGSALERIRALEARFLIQGPTGPQGPAGPGATLSPIWQRIGFYIVPPALSPVASVSFTVSAGFNHVRLFWKARTSAAVGVQAVSGQFNGDVGATYYGEVGDDVNAALTGAGVAAATSVRLGIVPGSTATAGLFGSGVVDFPVIADAHPKWAIGLSGASSSLLAAGQQEERFAGYWDPAVQAVVASILIFPTAGGFITDSSFYLYAST